MASETSKEDYRKAGFNNTAITFVSKVLGYVWFMLVAYIFGTQTSTDIYYLGTSFVAACAGPFTILIISIFPPILIRLRTTATLQEALDFASSLFSWVMVIALAIGVIIMFFPVEVFQVVSKYSPTVLTGNKHLLVYFAFIFIVTVGVEFMRVFVQSMGQFTTTALIALVQSFILTLCLLTLSGILRVESMALGTLLSVMVQFSLLMWYSYSKKIPIRISFKPNKHIKELLRVGMPLWIGHWVTMAAIYYTDYAASGLQGGVLTAVTFSQKIYILPVLILFNPLLEIINTKFAESFHRSRETLRNDYMAITGLLFYIMIPISIFMILFRMEIVHLLFVRGAFTEGSALITANCLAVYALIMVSSCLLQINARTIFTLQKTGWTTVFGTTGFFLTIAATHYFVQWFGYWGIPMGKVVVELFYFIPYTTMFMYIYLRKLSISGIAIRFLRYAVMSLGIAGIVRFALVWILQLFDTTGIPQNAVNFVFLSAAGLICVLSYIYISKLLRISELNYILSVIKLRFSKPVPSSTV